jgi:tetratricopeptide (TPR) repeat protein
MIMVVATGDLFAAETEDHKPCGVRQARAHFELGQAHLKLERYEQAMADFEAGWACIPMPVFLYDIAQMARFSGQRAKALDYYKRYLLAEPHARERVAVERWIAVLSKGRNQAQTAPPRPSAAPVVIGPTAVRPAEPPPAPAPAPLPAPAMPSSAPAVDAVAATPHVADKPSHRGRWIALGVVGGVLVVGGAVTAGVLLGRPQDSGIPNGFHDFGPVDAKPH